MLQNALVLSAFLAVSASAGQVAHTVPFGPVPIGGSIATTLPQFDPALGVLRTVRLQICPQMTGSVGYENTSAQTVTFGGNPLHVGVIMNWSIGAFGYPPAGMEYFVPTTSLPAYDGVTDFGGASGITYNFTNQVGGNRCPTLDLEQDAYLDAYVGTGTVPTQVGPVTLSDFSQPPAAIASNVSLVVAGTLRVEYLFDAFPIGICSAMPGSGCPCGNFSPLARGCGNSVEPFGAELSYAGTASIANDTLTLHGSGMTNSNALYFQGTSFVHAQSVYGDGLRCVTGSVVRLGTRTNAGGASQVPSVGGTSLHMVGGVGSPGTRYYQIIYRDNGAFCTTSNFNASSGLAVGWTL